MQNKSLNKEEKLSTDLTNTLWWFFFIVFAVIAQKYFSGIDFLIIGFIILLQEEKLKQILILAPILFFLQESISTFAFGSTILWYFSAFALLIIGKLLFEVENFLFMFLYSSALSFMRIAIFEFMAQLEGMNYNITYVADTSVLQALVMPVAWTLLTFTRPKHFDEPVAM